jgi:hypothetical protein
MWLGRVDPDRKMNGIKAGSGSVVGVSLREYMRSQGTDRICKLAV